MDGKGRCQDNLFVERLWRAAKYEEVYLKAYADVLEAQKGNLMEGGVRRERGPNNWQESRDSHLTPP